MREWVVEAVKMYYIDLITHGIAFLSGMGIGILGVRYEEEIYQGFTGNEGAEAHRRAKGVKDKEDGSKDGHQDRERR